MPARSCREWEQVGTEERDPAEYHYSPVAVMPETVQPSSSPLEQAQDPQPFNPRFQQQTGITDWINLKALGARGDGIADDTGIFQAANLIAQTGGQPVYIPAGTYKLTSSITFSNGVQWLSFGTVTGGTLSGGTQLVFGGAGGGLTNPMTTTGDMIVGGSGGTPGRLAPGTNGQGLIVSGGVPAWGNILANPMTTTGDLIVGGSGGTPGRLAAGPFNTVLQSTATGVAWAPVSAAIVIQPSGDATGATDTTAIQNANNALTGGGLILLSPGAFYITAVTLSGQTTAGNSGGNPVSLAGCGPATTLFVVGGGTGISYHRTSGYGAQFGLTPTDHAMGFIRDLVIDGTNATSGAIGLDAGDGWGGVIENVFIQNFTASGCIGANLINRGLWSEKWRIILHSQNNATAVVFDTTTGGGSLPSHEFCDITLYLFCNYGQQGVVQQNGAWFGNCSLKFRGNFGTGAAAPTTAAWTLTGNNGNGVNTHVVNCHLEIAVESDQNGANGPMSIQFGSTAPSIHACEGLIAFNGSPWTASNLASGQISFTGLLVGDANIAANNGFTTPKVTYP